MGSTGKRPVGRTLRPALGIYRCPRECGWRREFHLDPVWQEEVVDHPGYGKVKEIGLVNLDIANHECKAYIAAAERLRKAQKERHNGN